MPDVSIREGMTALKEHIFDNLPCELEQRYLVLCWFITAFLLDYAPYMALMKFSGPTSSGKDHRGEAPESSHLWERTSGRPEHRRHVRGKQPESSSYRR